MNLCSDGHDEVCYDVRKCPVCRAMEATGAERDRADALQIELDEANQYKDEEK